MFIKDCFSSLWGIVTWPFRTIWSCVSVCFWNTTSTKPADEAPTEKPKASPHANESKKPPPINTILTETFFDTKNVRNDRKIERSKSDSGANIHQKNEEKRGGFSVSFDDRLDYLSEQLNQIVRERNRKERQGYRNEMMKRIGPKKKIKPRTPSPEDSNGSSTVEIPKDPKGLKKHE